MEHAYSNAPIFLFLEGEKRQSEPTELGGHEKRDRPTPIFNGESGCKKGASVAASLGPGKLLSATPLLEALKVWTAHCAQTSTFAELPTEDYMDAKIRLDAWIGLCMRAT